MSGRWPTARMRRLPQADWPAADAAAWTAASNPRPGPFNRNRRRSPATYRMYAEAYAGFLWYLQSEGQLDPGEPLAERVTPTRFDHYYERLVQSGCADYTLITRFEALHGALRLMHPDRDLSFVIQPGGVSIRQRLDMNRRERFVPDSRHAELWAETLFHAALTLPDPGQRQRQVRDAALIGIMASRAPRLRAGGGMRLRHLRRVGDQWVLDFNAGLMKDGKSGLELPLSARVGAIVERYLAVERGELLRGQTHDFVWVAREGGPLSEKGIDFMMRSRTKVQYGVAFGAHRFRAGLTTTQALVDGQDMLGTSRILAHSPAVALKHYNRAGALEASRRHGEYIDAAEDAAARMLGQGKAKLPKPKPVRSLHDLKRRRKRSRP
jgi:hypothetical protein